MKSETCARCGEEVRRGYRGGRLAWWHRDDQPPPLTITRRDTHEPVFGNATPSELQAAPDLGETDDRDFELPAPEVYAIEVPEGKMPGGAKNLIGAVERAGGRTRATYSRGPRVHSSHGNLLEISDWVMVKFERDGRHGVARWVCKSGDWALDCAYIIHYRDGLIYPMKTDSKGLRAHLLKWQGPLQEAYI